MSFGSVAMAVGGFFFLVGGMWAITHPDRVDASYSRGTDGLSLPPWTRTFVGMSNLLIGTALVIGSIFS